VQVQHARVRAGAGCGGSLGKWLQVLGGGRSVGCFSLPHSRMLFIALHHHGPRACTGGERSDAAAEARRDCRQARGRGSKAPVCTPAARSARAGEGGVREGGGCMPACLHDWGRGMGEARMQGPHGLRWLCPSRINRVHTLPLPCWKRGLNSTAPHCPAPVYLPAAR